ncbi:MAG: sigma-54-dependent transcriptional regulator [Nitrospiria bacterium]
MSETILVVDDEPAILTTLSGILSDEGYEIQTAESGLEVIPMVQDKPPALVLLDIWMPEPDGIETLQRLKTFLPDLIVIMMSGHGSIETAVKAIKLGAYDYIEKPLSLEKVVLMVKHALNEFRLKEENRSLKRLVAKKYEMVGASRVILRLKEQIALAGPSHSRVLISGENGTGKELVARMIHSASPRRNAPFLDVNCAAIPENLIESELFGYEKGAFTGASQRKKGQFERASGGTLFLDEIGDMTLPTQAKVLRALQEQAFMRVGGHERVHVDVRVIAASNKDLPTEIKAGRFRDDLYYRLNVIPLHAPPLRDRIDDIPLLISYFIKDVAQEQGIRPKRLTSEAFELLKAYSWPGNVRELKNIAERLLIMAPTPIISSHDLPQFIKDSAPHLQDTAISGDEKASSQPLKTARSAFERAHILSVLKAHDWNIPQTAEALQIERTHLYRKMKVLNITPPTENLTKS